MAPIDVEDESGDGFLPPPILRRRVPEQGMPLVCTRLEVRANGHLPAGEDRSACSRCFSEISVPRHLALRLESCGVAWIPMCSACVTDRDRDAMAAYGRRP